MTASRDTGKHKIPPKSAGKRRARRLWIAAAAVLVVAALIVVGICLFVHYRSYDKYKVKQTLSISNSGENISYYQYASGYLKVASDGVTYFTKKGEVWSETYEMNQPIVDICGDYIAVADIKTTDVYLYDLSGYLNRISSTHSIVDVEVSEYGAVAVAAIEDTSNYIEIRDRDGNEVLTAHSMFSTSGYLSDISTSSDGNKLAASFLYVSEGSLESKVLFYDFSKGSSSDDVLVGGFNQYESIVVMNVEFMDDDTVCVVGDCALTIYSFDSAPSIVYEDLELPWEIQSLFFSEDKYVGFVVVDDSLDNNYCIKVYNMQGKLVMDKGFDFNYTKAAFAGKNVILYSNNDCEIYSFSGVRRFSYTFDDRIIALESRGNVRDLIYARSSAVDFIHLK